MQVLVLIAFFLIIPEIIVRVLMAEQFARLSDFTSLGGIFNHILSLLIFLGIVSILLGVLAIQLTKNLSSFNPFQKLADSFSNHSAQRAAKNQQTRRVLV